MRVEESIDVDRPVEAVWAVVADHAQDPRWCRKVQSAERVEEGRWRLRHRPVPLRPALELAVEDLDVEPPHRLTMRETDDGSRFDVEYRIASAVGGARFTQISDFEFERLPRLLRDVFARGVRRDVRGQLRALKELVESGG
ncbi:MAG: SRPBCC family protein [Solirubrobacteraceae bacterium]